jgi:hypothetical protein
VKGEHCRFCYQIIRDEVPMKKTCIDCAFVFENMAEVHYDDKHNHLHTANPDRIARVEQYAAIVASGGRLFE